ncbi:XAC2610-related protein [Phytopseudomonas dryadis]|uniref:Nitrite reductase n=1 Tax=Phytopseudomonas dryadis TaxID=2487520 RepID=A0ABY1Z8R2_9GAMM|nr:MULTISPECIES: nitrite reductase [Pseudomonas]TBV07808.1 nitrite reductase [Pseudomonas dryadis]TBV19203.1 nitrite reductase [Pseudomonas sp. FRB 230]
MRATRGFLSCFPFILALVWLPAMPVNAAQVPASSVEFPVWSRSWDGTLGSRQVKIMLNRIADGLSGSYCYQPCKAQTRSQLVLTGRMRGEGAELTERDSGHGADTTGIWHIESLQDGITGTWTSPNGKRTLPLALRQIHTQDDLTARFPYEIRLLADSLPGEEDDDCNTPPLVSAIRLYKDGTLFQTLETESEGTCSIFTPALVDANFDGWPDLSLALFLPAGPNIPQQTWLYDATTGRFADAPASLQAISSAEFDPVHRTVYSYWRASCCEHGVSTYRWKGSEVEEVETRSSYFLPLLDGATRRLCYIAPSYGDGFIEFASRVEQTADGRLRLRQIDPKTCDIDDGALLERMYIDIWKPDPRGQKPTLLRTEEIAWKPTQTPAGQRYCPEVPFFDSGHVRRMVFSENPGLCREEGSPQE